MYNKLQKMKVKAESRGHTDIARVIAQEMRYHQLTLRGDRK